MVAVKIILGVALYWFAGSGLYNTYHSVMFAWNRRAGDGTERTL